MTMEEKRDAVMRRCDDYTNCQDCPCGGDHYCISHHEWSVAPDHKIEEAYDLLFPSTPTIKDSGERREFPTGAVRDIQEGKGRCDLLPLDVVAHFLGTSEPMLLLGAIDDFQRSNDIDYLYLALSHFDEYDPITMLLEVAIHFEQGCQKYGENNWQKGIPTHCYIDSAVRHYLKWYRGDKDERHDRAFVWNILCCIWTCIHKPELNDYCKVVSAV